MSANRVVSITVGNAEYTVPEVFEDEVLRLNAAMDWARCASEHHDYFMAAGELRLAAKWARALGDVCEEFAVNAEILSAKQSVAV